MIGSGRSVSACPGHLLLLPQKPCSVTVSPEETEGSEMRIHHTASPFAGKTVRIKQEITHPQLPSFGGAEFRVEDWWDRVYGDSWMGANGNPVCMIYAMRTGLSSRPVPTDNEVLYGKIGSFGHLVHITEIEHTDVVVIHE